MAKEISRVQVPYADIVVGEDFNSRKTFTNIKELAASLREHGLIQPLVVREGGPVGKDEKRRKYFLIAGARRYRAITLLRETEPQKWNVVEVKLVKGNSEENAILNLIENLQREGLEPLEEAQAMVDYMERYDVNQAALAERLGVSEPYVSQKLSMLRNTAPEVKEAIGLPVTDPNHISQTAAREMVTLPKADQVEILKDVQEKQKKLRAAATKTESKSKRLSVPVSEIKDAADKRKDALGIRKEKAKKKTNGESYDTEKVSMAKEVYEGNLRPKTAVLEVAGLLMERVKRPNISDDTKRVAKGQLVLIEYLLGMRDSL